MKRTVKAAIGILAAMAALLLIAAGCTADNPVSPSTTAQQSPGNDAILCGAEICSDLLDEDVMIDEPMLSDRPDHIVFDGDNPVVIDPGDRENVTDEPMLSDRPDHIVFDDDNPVVIDPGDPENITDEPAMTPRPDFKEFEEDDPVIIDYGLRDNDAELIE